MKNLFISLSLLLTLAVSSCKNDEPNKVANIEVGTNNADTLYVNRDQKIFFLLKGGDNKYKANTEDAKIATAEINKDSLFITGHFNGGTPLTIHSHDLQRRLFIKVVPPPFDATEKVVTLAPGDDARTLNLAGGGPKATLTQEGPEKDAAKITWDAKTGNVRIQALYEGDVKLVATSEDGKTKKEILVQIRCQGESSKFGAYTTNSRSISSVFPVVMTAHRRGQFVRFSETSNPLTSQKSNPKALSRDNRVLTITPELANPKVGDQVELTLNWLSEYSSISSENPIKKDGKYKAIVTEVQDRKVTVRGAGFKFVLPYVKNLAN